MGVDTQIMLPANVRLNNVAKVVGVAAGLKPCWHKFRDGGGEYLRVEGVELNTTSVPEMAVINLRGPMADGESNHFVYFHFEGEHGGRLLNPRSTTFWILIGRRLVEFFGGWQNDMDCDDTINYAVLPKSDEMNRPTNDLPWRDLQKRITEVRPITAEELAEFGKAAY